MEHIADVPSNSCTVYKHPSVIESEISEPATINIEHLVLSEFGCQPG